ncbi:hypothetical protein E2C01_010054 [Portunus trituberculatus]|uniref:Uncharacterized protein n=1 Tax=Portunus trituberculatus TaxID=210409 RepID=A0A5B7D7G1_PORTR|nr:hypothetical protein [Portunus trituberculatus]
MFKSLSEQAGPRVASQGSGRQAARVASPSACCLLPAAGLKYNHDDHNARGADCTRLTYIAVGEDLVERGLPGGALMWTIHTSLHCTSHLASTRDDMARMGAK